MIISQFNNDIQNQFNQKQFNVGEIEFDEKMNKLTLIAYNDITKKQIKLITYNPLFSEEDFELKDSKISKVYVKSFKNVFSSKYFDCASIELIDNKGQKTNRIRSQEGLKV